LDRRNELQSKNSSAGWHLKGNLDHLTLGKIKAPEKDSMAFNLILVMAGLRKRFAFFEPIPQSGHGAAAKVVGTLGMGLDDSTLG